MPLYASVCVCVCVLARVCVCVCVCVWRNIPWVPCGFIVVNKHVLSALASNKLATKVRVDMTLRTKFY